MFFIFTLLLHLWFSRIFQRRFRWKKIYSSGKLKPRFLFDFWTEIVYESMKVTNGLMTLPENFGYSSNFTLPKTVVCKRYLMITLLTQSTSQQAGDFLAWNIKELECVLCENKLPFVMQYSIVQICSAN